MSKKSGISGNSLDSSVALDAASVPADRALREILDSSQHIIYRANFVSGGYDYVSTAATALLGVSLEELQQRGMEILRTRMPPEDWSRCVTHFEELARANPGKSTRTRIEYRLLLTDGGTAWFSDSAIADADAAGKLLAVHGIATDINEKKRAQAALEEKTRLLEDFFSQSIDGCFVLRFDQPMAASSIVARGGEAARFPRFPRFLSCIFCGSTKPLRNSSAAMRS
ncbi:MAG: PAS domain-containing protein [Betaproteobacteria bacterium]|nr:PAS domain-containing protein [Betaproteobacteria bacterium]